MINSLYINLKDRIQDRMVRKKIATVMGCILLLVMLPLLLYVVRQRVSYRGKAAGPESAPTNIRITNVHSKGFTISWITSAQTNGSVIYATGSKVGGTPPFEKKDIRTTATTINFYTHYVDFFGLSPETNYYLKIKSGPDTYAYSEATNSWYKTSDPNAYGKRVRTAKQLGDGTNPSSSNPPGAYSLEQDAFKACSDGKSGTISACFRSYPIWGQVKNTSNQIVTDALVYAVIRDDGVGIGSIGAPNAISTITNNLGKWALDLANQYTTDFQNYFAYDPAKDKISVSAYSHEKMGALHNLPMASVFTLDSILMDVPSPVTIVLTIPIPTPIISPTEIPTVSISPTLTPSLSLTPTQPPTVSPSPTPNPSPTLSPSPTLTPAPPELLTSHFYLQTIQDNADQFNFKADMSFGIQPDSAKLKVYYNPNDVEYISSSNGQIFQTISPNHNCYFSTCYIDLNMSNGRTNVNTGVRQHFGSILFRLKSNVSSTTLTVGTTGRETYVKHISGPDFSLSYTPNTSIIYNLNTLTAPAPTP